MCATGGGIGNVLLGDDGVGPCVARLLAAHYEFEEGVEVEDLGTPILDLIDAISGKDAVILIDSIRVETVLPGTVLRYNKTEIMRECLVARMDPRSPALMETPLSVELFGTAPTQVLLIGIAGESYQSGCSLSAPVTAAVSRVVEAVLCELAHLGVEWRRRQSPLDSGIWWAPVDQIGTGAV